MVYQKIARKVERLFATAVEDSHNYGVNQIRAMSQTTQWNPYFSRKEVIDDTAIACNAGKRNPGQTQGPNGSGSGAIEGRHMYFGNVTIVCRKHCEQYRKTYQKRYKPTHYWVELEKKQYSLVLFEWKSD